MIEGEGCADTGKIIKYGCCSCGMWRHCDNWIQITKKHSSRPKMGIYLSSIGTLTFLHLAVSYTSRGNSFKVGKSLRRTLYTQIFAFEVGVWSPEVLVSGSCWNCHINLGSWRHQMKIRNVDERNGWFEILQGQIPEHSYRRPCFFEWCFASCAWSTKRN